VKELKPGTYTVKASDLEFDGNGQPRLKPDANPIPTILRKPRSANRIRKSPLEDHPREAETRRMMLEARIDDEQEVMDLQASELACAVADAWARARPTLLCGDYPDLDSYAPGLEKALNRLELITRPSAMRKIRP
jgi:hypothetical protein